MKSLLRKKSAWLPIAMSFTAVLWTFGYIAVVGINRKKVPHDEGIGARVFQLLILLQLPIILAFLIKWLPRKPKHTVIILFLQVLAILLAFTPIYILEL